MFDDYFDFNQYCQPCLVMETGLNQQFVVYSNSFKQDVMFVLKTYLLYQTYSKLSCIRGEAKYKGKIPSGINGCSFSDRFRKKSWCYPCFSDTGIHLPILNSFGKRIFRVSSTRNNKTPAKMAIPHLPALKGTVPNAC